MIDATESDEIEEGGRRYKGQSASERRTERRERLLETGFEMFGTGGYHATSIPTLCAMAGVNTRQFYEAFETREQLFVAVYERLLWEWHEFVTTAVLKIPAEIDARAQAGIGALVSFATDDPRRARIMCVESKRVNSTVEERQRSALLQIAGVIDREFHRLIDEGVLEYKTNPAMSIALAGAVDSTLAAWVLQQPELDVVDVRNDLVELFIAVSKTMVPKG